jgi:hypothetical protein
LEEGRVGGRQGWRKAGLEEGRVGGRQGWRKAGLEEGDRAENSGLFDDAVLAEVVTVCSIV